MRKAAITVNRSVDEIKGLWSERRPPIADDASVTFKAAPGDRGTEIHVDLGGKTRAGKAGEIARKFTGSDPVANTKDALRRFKQQVETGEVPRSDATPEGESLQRKLDQRPAQPLSEKELEEVGVR